MASLFGPSSGSGSINIRRDVQDAFYRYKMPRLQSKIEGKGNGIKTVIPNMVDIARALHRPPSYITKFFGAELGALSTCDEKAAKFIVNGAHDAEKLQTLLDGFISKFVLCPNCDNPETVLSVSKKDGTIYRTCQACGHRSTVDPLHKLNSFIRANPPPKPAKKSQAKDRAEDAGEMASAMKGARSSPLAKGDGALEPEESIEGMIAPDDFDDALNGADVTGRLGEEDWDEEAAAALRQDELAHLSESVRQKLSLSAANGAPAAGDEMLDALDQFGDWLAANSAASDESIKEQIRERAIRADKAVVVIVQVLLAEDFARTFRQRVALLRDLTEADDKAQKALLGSVERLVGVLNPDLLEKIPMILQMLYTSDLVEEEALQAWREKPSKRYASKEVATLVRKKAQPFFVWLETATEDEEEDDDEDEE